MRPPAWIVSLPKRLSALDRTDLHLFVIRKGSITTRMRQDNSDGETLKSESPVGNFIVRIYFIQRLVQSKGDIRDLPEPFFETG